MIQIMYANNNVVELLGSILIKKNDKKYKMYVHN